ncbi:MAG TPA: hypothetical protein VGI72_07610 [Gaiellales bacterium]|jgi:hypothetical protein
MLRVNRILSVAFIVIGVVLLIETAVLGGGEVGFVAGAVFIALGILRRRAMRPPRPRG